MPFSHIVRVLIKDVRFFFFTAALFLYAFWGSPTPDNPGLIELAIGIFLIVFVGFTGVVKNIIHGISQKTNRWVLSITCLLLYGLSVPVVMAVVKGAPVSVILRDIIGFIFLCLPLFLVPFIRKYSVQNQSLKAPVFLISIILIGLLFSFRVVFSNFVLWQSSVELLYLANSPLVLFSSLFLFSLSFYKVFEKITFNSIKLSLLYLALVSIPFLAMFADLQRVSVLAIVLSVVFLTCLGMIKAPLKMILPIALFALALIITLPYVSGVIKNVGVKTSQVGFNMRLQEIYALWDSMSGSWIAILFGQGWGSSFASPAVGELQVTFTHSLLSYVFFKMGLIGLFLTLVYLFFIFEKLLSLYFSDPLKGNALMWPLLIPIFLYASHKSFDFGLLLSLILVSAESGQRQVKVMSKR